MKKFYSLVILALLLCHPLQAQLQTTVTITSGGVDRQFTLRLPAILPPANVPVLLCYHGTGGTSASMIAVTGFNALADQHSFIVVYPQALKIGNDVQWNVYVDDKPGHEGVGVDDAPDDVRFTRDIIAYLKTTYGIDEKRVFATGLSNGGFMSYALSMLAPDAIAAIAPVAGNMWANSTYLEQLVASGSAKPMPVMHVHGTADDVVGYVDPDNTPKDYEEYPLFVAARGCSGITYSQVIPVMDKVDKLLFCPPPVEVFLLRIKGMGHTWTNGEYQTSSEIVKFFGLVGGTNGVSELQTPAELSIAPNPAGTFLRVELPSDGTVQLFSSIGALVYSAGHRAGSVTISCSDLPAGLYMVRVLSRNGIATKSVSIAH